MGAHANTHDRHLGNGVVAGHLTRSDIFCNFLEERQSWLVILPLHRERKIRHAVDTRILNDHVDFDIFAPDGA